MMTGDKPLMERLKEYRRILDDAIDKLEIRVPQYLIDRLYASDIPDDQAALEVYRAVRTDLFNLVPELRPPRQNLSNSE